MSHPAPSCVYRKARKNHPPAPFSLDSSTARRGAAPCGAHALSCPACGAMLCRALECFLFRKYQTTTPASIHSWRKTAYMSSGILYSSPSLQYRYVVVEPRVQHSTAQHSTAQHSTAAQSPLHKAANQVRADQSTCQKKYVSYVMHDASRLFS